ncbi:DUF4118 domain-containing protein [Streptomyces sp. INA 01156]
MGLGGRGGGPRGAGPAAQRLRPGPGQRHAAVPGADRGGGPARRPAAALASAAFGSLLLNYFYTPPLHRWTISDPKNIVAIVIFVAVGAAVASVVDLAARRTHQAARLRAESEILSFLAGNVLRGETGLEALLERVRETFGMESAALLERAGDVEPWTCAGRAGTGPVLERPTTRTWTFRSGTTWRSS